MSNTKVTVTYANGDTREFIATDALEELINEGEMFGIATLHSDISVDEEVQLSKMYAGNPISALGHMLQMRKNAQELHDGGDDSLGPVIETLNACITILSNETTSHQSGMSPVQELVKQ